LRFLRQPGFLLQLLLQLPASIAEVLQGLVQLGLAGSLGLLELPRVLKFSLDELLLQFRGDVPLSIQSLAVLKGELFLLGCNPEKEKRSIKEADGLKRKRQMNK
jgi:hypothetical protein